MADRTRFIPTVEYLASTICKCAKACKSLQDPSEIQANYSEAEKVFQAMMDRMQLTDNMGNPARIDVISNHGYYENASIVPRDADAFQRAICSLVRYAPTRDKALKYLCFYLHQIGPPLRTAKTEITMLINIIYMYAQESRSSLKVAQQALDFIKIGLERDVLNIPPTVDPNDSFQDQASVFYSVSKPILLQLRVRFSQDRRSLVQVSYHNRYMKYRLHD